MPTALSFWGVFCALNPRIDEDVRFLFPLRHPSPFSPAIQQAIMRFHVNPGTISQDYAPPQCGVQAPADGGEWGGFGARRRDLGGVKSTLV